MHVEGHDDLPIHGGAVRLFVKLIWVPVVAVCATCSAVAQTPLPMKDYNNARFAYHLSYPPSLLKPLPEADDGDGRAFQPANGHADTRVFGGYVSADSGQTIDGETKSALADCAGGKATYRLDKPDIQVVSCMRPDGSVLYVKTLQAKGTLIELRMQYPQTEKSVWDPVAAAMSKSLKFL
jgi:hypothetical protein